MIKRLLFGGGLAVTLVVAFLLGSLTLGVAGAQTPTAPATPQTTVQQDQANQEQQQPSYTGSIQAPQDQEGQSEQDEAKALAGMAKTTADQAKQAALAQFQGATVKKVELENENGFVVYGVQLTDESGKAQDVKVDAGNGKVLATEADGSEGDDGNGTLEKAGAED
ncbi:MAG: PepSY domain-containing protein [Chloroflexota bacterium]